MRTINQLCDVVRETAYPIHAYHGHGHLEKVYENALAHRLRKAGLDVKQQHPITVLDEDGTVINFGSYKFEIKKYAMSQAIRSGGSSVPLRSLRSFAAVPKSITP